MDGFRTAGEWRGLIRANRQAGEEIALTMRGPRVLRDFYAERASALGLSISDLLRWAALDWAMIASTPNRKAFHDLLAALWEIHRTADEDLDLVAQRPEVWADPHPALTPVLEKLVRADDGEWAEQRNVLLMDRAKYREMLDKLTAEAAELRERPNAERGVAVEIQGSLLAEPTADDLTAAVRRVIRELRDAGEL